MTQHDEADGISNPIPIPTIMKLTCPDALSQRGAMTLAKRLQRFWHDQGYPAARFWAEPIGERFRRSAPQNQGAAIMLRPTRWNSRKPKDHRGGT